MARYAHSYSPRDAWIWYLSDASEHVELVIVYSIDARTVARDILLDGNTFATSYRIDKNNFVADATAGASLTYNNTRISYTVVYRTKEFKTQDNPEVSGALSVAVRF